jgi:hypothetical protein
MRTKRRMTGLEFEAIRPYLNISEDRENAARLALVEGQTLQGVANIYKWSRQAVGDAVAVVWRTYERYHESQRAAANAGALMPPGWEQVTLIAPTHLIAKFRAEIAAASPQPQAVEAVKKSAPKRVAKTK